MDRFAKLLVTTTNVNCLLYHYHFDYRKILVNFLVSIQFRNDVGVLRGLCSLLSCTIAKGHLTEQ